MRRLLPKERHLLRPKGRHLLLSKGLLLLLLIGVLPGCWDRLEVENVAFIVGIGLDLDENNNLLVYSYYPVFEKEAKQKTDFFEVKSTSLRQAREKIDAIAAGISEWDQAQIVLVGKQLLKNKDWFPLLDVLYRDVRNKTSASIIYMDGPVAKAILASPPDKVRFVLYMKSLVEASERRFETINVNLEDLQRQMFEAGMTPVMPRAVQQKEFKLDGLALLNKKGKYVDKLRGLEVPLLLILQNKVKGDVSLTLRLPDIPPGEGPVPANIVSFNASDMRTRIKTSYAKNRFRFDMEVKGDIAIREKVFSLDAVERQAQLEEMVTKQLQSKLEALLNKIQKRRLDPIGLGIFARAYEHKQWKQVQDHWGEALSEADIAVKVKIRLINPGPKV